MQVSKRRLSFIQKFNSAFFDTKRKTQQARSLGFDIEDEREENDLLDDPLYGRSGGSIRHGGGHRPRETHRNRFATRTETEILAVLSAHHLSQRIPLRNVDFAHSSIHPRYRITNKKGHKPITSQNDDMMTSNSNGMEYVMQSSKWWRRQKTTEAD